MLLTPPISCHLTVVFLLFFVMFNHSSYSFFRLNGDGNYNLSDNPGVLIRRLSQAGQVKN